MQIWRNAPPIFATPMNDDAVAPEEEETVEVNLYEEVELHTNCTVQILRNVLTGELSIGWWENDEL